VPAEGPGEEVKLDVMFCSEVSGDLPKNRDQQCQRTAIHTHPDALQAWLVIQKSGSQEQLRSLLVAPYYHGLVEIFKLNNGSWELIQSGGSSLGGGAASASLGGHRFTLRLASERSDLLVRISGNTTGVRHIAIDLEDNPHGLNKAQGLLVLHLGMLMMMVALMLISWLTDPSVLGLRLLLLTFFALLSVLIGSGTVYLVWPSASPHWWGIVIFNASTALRLVCLAWIYEAMLQAFQPGELYRTLNRCLYGLAFFACVAFAIDLVRLGWLINIFLLVAVFVVIFIGIRKAADMPEELKRILWVYWLGAVLMSMLAIVGMWFAEGNNQVPIYLSRGIDIFMPLGMLATVLLRNKVAEQEFLRTKEALDSQRFALESERQSRQEKHMLLDMLTHEIKNPMATIRLAVTNLLQSRAHQADPLLRRLENIENSVTTIDQILEHCNLANSIEDERIRPQMQWVDLAKFLAEEIASLLPERRLTLESSPNLSILTDPYLLHFVALNLFENALKYSAPMTPIEVVPFEENNGRVRACGWRISNSVASNMMPDIDRIFERYYRHPLAQVSRGSGLGLSICRQICTLLGGQINCRLVSTQIIFEVAFEQA